MYKIVTHHSHPQQHNSPALNLSRKITARNSRDTFLLLLLLLGDHLFWQLLNEHCEHDFMWKLRTKAYHHRYMKSQVSDKWNAVQLIIYSSLLTLF